MQRPKVKAYVSNLKYVDGLGKGGQLIQNTWGQDMM